MQRPGGRQLVVVVMGAVLVTAVVAVAKVEVGRVLALVVALVGSLGVGAFVASSNRGPSRAGRTVR